MKKLFYCFTVLLIAISVGCSNKYDDTEVWKSINLLEQRITAMETVMKAYENKLLITNVSETTDGYIITFTDGSKATIMNGKDGSDGINGVDGENGETYIRSITVDENDVLFELTDGQKFSILLADALSIEFDESDLLVMIGNQTRSIRYTITSMIEEVEIEVFSSADIKTKVVASEESKMNGSIQITTGDVIDEYSKIVVIVSNGKRVLMRRFNFSDEGLGVYDNTQKSANYGGGELELEFLTSVAYDVIIPNEASSWINYKGSTRGIERKTILLEIGENPGYTREANVCVQSEDGAMSVQFHIVQNANKAFVEASERQVLIDIYNSLGGKNWDNSYKWCTDAPLGEWAGITTDDVTGHITAIRFNEFDMAGEIPPSIGNLKELKSLHLYATAITKLPDEMGMLKNLEYFHIGAKYNTGNHISGQLPKSFCSLKKLKYLKIFNHKISSIPIEFSQLENLEYLDLNNNILEGSILEIVCSLTNLKELDLCGNRLSGSISASIGNLSSLEHLRLGVNNLSGSIPTEIGALRNLKYLYIGNNAISGSLPSSMANLSKLEELHLGTMNLSGEIPSWLGELKKLKALNLEFNNFSGAIPENLTQLTNLTFLSLWRNELNGPIPAGFGNIPGLEDFKAAINKLTGTIPEDLGNLKNLLLYNNQLTGKIPESVLKSDYWQNAWGQITVGNNFELDNITFPGPNLTTLYKDMAQYEPFYIADEYAKNKFTVLFQWSAACAYLEDATNMLISLHNQYSSLGLKIIGRSYPEQSTLTTISKYGMPWKNYYSPQLDYPTYVAPTITVIDRSGMVVFTDMIQDRFDLPKFFETIFSK